MVTPDVPYWRNGTVLPMAARFYGPQGADDLLGYDTRTDRQAGLGICAERLGRSAARTTVEERALALRHHGQPEVANGGIGLGGDALTDLFDKHNPDAENGIKAEREQAKRSAETVGLKPKARAGSDFNMTTLVTPFYVSMLPFDTVRDATKAVDEQFTCS